MIGHNLAERPIAIENREAPGAPPGEKHSSVRRGLLGWIHPDSRTRDELEWYSAMLPSNNIPAVVTDGEPVSEQSVSRESGGVSEPEQQPSLLTAAFTMKDPSPESDRPRKRL